MTKNNKLYLIIAVLVTSILFFSLGMGMRSDRSTAQVAQPVETIVIKDEGGFANVISDTANALIPAVVHIDITGTIVQKTPEYGLPFGNDPFFRYFFGPPQQKESKIPIRALGSGVIINKDGYIITNNHVVQNAETIEVELYDGTKHKAKLIGKDPRTDLAVVKIDPSPEMKYANFGNSDDCKVGEWVISIGSPRGLDWTVTAGIISAKNRKNIGALGPTGYEDFIQTDASINPGNSGGPLINLKGEVIGINSLIVSTSQGSEGLGFAIPSNMAKAISESLINHGKVVRGYLGVTIQDVTDEMAKSLNLGKNFKGVIISDILPASPAAKSGIEQGDIIIKYDGKKVENTQELRYMVAATNPDTYVKLGILRDKNEIEITVRIGELEKVEEEAKAQKEKGSELLGLTVEKVTHDIAKKLGLRKTVGVIITDIKRGSASDKVGLSPGDIIFRVGSKEVSSPKEFYKYVSEASKDEKVLLLVRDAQRGVIGYIVVPLG